MLLIDVPGMYLWVQLFSMVLRAGPTIYVKQQHRHRRVDSLKLFLKKVLHKLDSRKSRNLTDSM